MSGWRLVHVHKAKKQPRKKQHAQRHVVSAQAVPMVISSRVHVVSRMVISAVMKAVKIVHVALTSLPVVQRGVRKAARRIVVRAVKVTSSHVHAVSVMESSVVKRDVKIVRVALKTVRKGVPKVGMSRAHRAQRVAAMTASKSVVRVSASALN